MFIFKININKRLYDIFNNSNISITDETVFIATHR